jgi:hypothetical protein
MTKRSKQSAPEADITPALTISPENVCFIIVKAREFDVKDGSVDEEPGSNAADDQMADVLEEHADDPVVEELTSFINAMNVDEQIDLVALAWLGRGDYSAADWTSVRRDAAEAHNNRTAAYLLGASRSRSTGCSSHNDGEQGAGRERLGAISARVRYWHPWLWCDAGRGVRRGSESDDGCCHRSSTRRAPPNRPHRL